MSGEPMQTGLPPDSPSLSVAERYGSFPEYAASTQAAPRSAATSLDVARFHAFTGEISFSTDPAVRLYLDGGTVYHAERDGDPPIGQILRDVGVVEADQLERGMVRVGDVEHLGRLFDREPSIDQDAVLVVMETRTEAIVRELANRATASVTVSAYRHHPSGLHRWFVVSTDPAESHRPVSAVAQVDRSVVDELPTLRSTPSALEIEWTTPDPSGAPPAPLPAPEPAASPARPDQGDDGRPSMTPLSEFHIVWPDGTADEAIASEPVVEPPSMLPPPVVPDLPVTPDMTVMPDAAVVALDAPVGDPILAAPSLGDELDHPGPDPSFSIAPLEVERLPEPDAAVPDDVAAAVKRALRAIESASTGRVSVPELSVAEVTLPEISVPEAAPVPVPASSPAPDSASPDPAPASMASPAAPTPIDETAPATPLGFAPPTPDMRAEAVYARAVAAAQVEASDQPAPDPVGGDTAGAEATELPGPGRASVVFVDDDPEPAAERRGALRRLINSLRHKDD